MVRFVNHRISEEDLSQLQANLMMSHACGTGEEVPHEIVKLMLLLKVQSLSYGNSGVQLITVQRLVDMYNKDILPIIYQQGSLRSFGRFSSFGTFITAINWNGRSVLRR